MGHHSGERIPKAIVPPQETGDDAFFLDIWKSPEELLRRILLRDQSGDGPPADLLRRAINALPSAQVWKWEDKNWKRVMGLLIAYDASALIQKVSAESQIWPWENEKFLTIVWHCLEASESSVIVETVKRHLPPIEQWDISLGYQNREVLGLVDVLTHLIERDSSQELAQQAERRLQVLGCRAPELPQVELMRVAMKEAVEHTLDIWRSGALDILETLFTEYEDDEVVENYYWMNRISFSGWYAFLEDTSSVELLKVLHRRLCLCEEQFSRNRGESVRKDFFGICHSLDRLSRKKKSAMSIPKTGSALDLYAQGNDDGNILYVNSAGVWSTDVWQNLAVGDDIAVSPILSRGDTHEDPKYWGRVYTRFCGLTVADLFLPNKLGRNMFPPNKWSSQVFRHVIQKVCASMAGLQQKGIEHGHPHLNNITVEFIDKEYLASEKQAGRGINSVVFSREHITWDPSVYAGDPQKYEVVVRLIDWDRASYRK